MFLKRKVMMTCCRREKQCSLTKKNSEHVWVCFSFQCLGVFFFSVSGCVCIKRLFFSVSQNQAGCNGVFTQIYSAVAEERWRESVSYYFRLTNIDTGHGNWCQKYKRLARRDKKRFFLQMFTIAPICNSMAQPRLFTLFCASDLLISSKLSTLKSMIDCARIKFLTFWVFHINWHQCYS